MNIHKTKIVVFFKDRKPKDVFPNNRMPVETGKEFNYLGVIFSRTGLFLEQKSTI